MPERIIPLFTLAEKARPYIRSKHTKHVINIEEYDKFALGLDLLFCPYCLLVGFLNQHGKRKRKNIPSGEEPICAARIFCNDRGNMGGCGKSYSVVLFDRMWGYITCVTLWNFLLRLLEGQSIRKAWKPAVPPFYADCGYKLRQAFIRSQSHIRTLLSKLGPPGTLHGITDPVLQTIQHLKCAFKEDSCPIRAFQLHFQKPFLV